MARESIKAVAAKEVEELRISFEMALSDKQRYPVQEFAAFAEAVRRYVEVTKHDIKIHNSVVNSVNGLREFIQRERKRIPGDIVFQADRLECLLFVLSPCVHGDDAIQDCDSVSIRSGNRSA